ncbi:ACRO protein, partial [Sylvia borin]|nr:ACRO protein [Sylvia borin]
VNPGTWTGIASIQVTLENGTWHMCSGTLISRRWVLTAARCFTTAEDVHKWKVVLGATDLAQPGREAEVFQIKRVLKHKHYDHDSERNNIALVELEQPVECSDYIQLGCVPDRSIAVAELKTCYIAGWRATPESESSQECSPGVVGTGRAMLAAAPDPSLLAQGDSGGPLVCKDNTMEKFWLVGLASWGRGCARARRPGIFTSTQHFHTWI